MPPRILVINGPTASGKTAFAVELALQLGGEVVSADSMQIYRYMDVGTAKPTPEETMGVPHHMTDCVSPFESYSVSRYVEEAGAVCDDILRRGKVPVIVGGTGLYIESLIRGRSFAPAPENAALRAGLEEEYDRLGGGAMLERLAALDRERAEKLHPNDKKRIVRALEIALSGEKPSEHDRHSRETPPRFDAGIVVLNFASRAQLYDRIDRRVDRMMELGLADEVRRLMDMGLTPEHTAMQAIGYKEIRAALLGECTMDEAVETVKRESRRYAKRQLSWCARYDPALRIDFEKTPDFGMALQLSTAFFRGQV